MSHELEYITVQHHGLTVEEHSVLFSDIMISCRNCLSVTQTMSVLLQAVTDEKLMQPLQVK